MSIERYPYTHRLRNKKNGETATFHYGITSPEDTRINTFQTRIQKRPLPGEYPALREFILRDLVPGSGSYYPIGTLTDYGRIALLDQELRDLRIKDARDGDKNRQVFLKFTGVTFGVKLDELTLEFNLPDIITPELYCSGDVLFLPTPDNEHREAVLIGPLLEIA